MGQFIDLTGQKFNMLTVVCRGPDYISPKGVHAVQWYCQCDCGNPELTLVSGSQLRHKTNPTKSCGCLLGNNAKTAHKIHGGAYERLYNVWCRIKSRCYCATNNRYKNYGERGIVMCDEWKNSYDSFKVWAMSNGYQPEAPRGQCTIERIDVNGNYCPENCTWKTIKEQENNKTNSHYVEYNGEAHTISEWAEIIGIPCNTLIYRINHNWPIEKALNISL